MENYIVECRNKDVIEDAKNTGAILQEGLVNGEWTTNLQTQVILEEGDSIICRNSYIDERAESQQKIIIDEDTPIELQFIYYSMNWNGVKRVYNAPNWVTANTSDVQCINPQQNVKLPSAFGSPCIMCGLNSTGSDFEFQQKLTYQGQNALQGVGGFSVVAVYRNIAGANTIQRIELPQYNEVGWGTENTIDINITYDAENPPDNVANLPALGIYLHDDDGQPIFTQRMDGTKREYDDTEILALTGAVRLDDDVYTPKIGTVKFTLPQGNYDASELCEKINSLATENKGTPTDTFLTGNELLIQVGGNSEPNSEFNNFITADTINSTNIDRYGYKYQVTTIGTADRPSSIMGASQFVLAYSDENNRFSIQYAHTPIYSQADGSNAGDSELGGFCSSTRWQGDQTGNATPDLPIGTFQVAKNCGVAFTSLSPASFWSDQLGFDLNLFLKDRKGNNTTTPNPNCVLVSLRTVKDAPDGTQYTVQDQPSSVPLLLQPLKDGVNMTSGFVGISSAFNKGSNFQKVVTIPTPSVSTPTSDSAFVSIGTDTQDVKAGKSVLSATSGITSFGYFLIEVSAQFGGNNFLTPEQNFKHIVAIVSKYYQKQNYTSSTSADSIVYTHRGSSLLLNSFRCRILDSNKQLAQGIGEDNTVVLEIIKPPKKIKS